MQLVHGGGRYAVPCEAVAMVAWVRLVSLAGASLVVACAESPSRRPAIAASPRPAITAAKSAAAAGAPSAAPVELGPLVPAIPGEPLQGRLDGPHSTAVVWSPPKGPAIQFAMKGPRLLANYESPTYGPVRNASWPHGCGSVGTIRWEIAPAGRLTLTCNWADGPNFTFLRFRWNSEEGDLQLDDSGAISGQ